MGSGVSHLRDGRLRTQTFFGIEQDASAGYFGQGHVGLDADGRIIGVKCSCEADGYNEQLGSIIGQVLFALGLMSCKNVTRREGCLPRAIRRHPGRFATTANDVHYTLDIPGAREFRQSIEGVGEAQRKRLHIVRGHFADYTEGGGLFGKLHGRYYIAPHVRGSAAVGTVTKDYRVVAP